MSRDQDTIFALSSGRPPAAIAVVRISGPHAGAALTALIGRVPQARQAVLARVRDPRGGDPIDEALALWFPGPKSETGEDVAELQLHGGYAVIAATLAALGGIDGLRLAEPGEFTRRAFANGQLDLTAVEGLADLIAAETEAQRRQAFRHLKGLLGDKAEDWRRRLIEVLALVEAQIDFSDEADVPDDLVTPALAKVRALAAEIDTALAQGTRGERIREGFTVAIAGPPNAGKSTLLNRIAKREAAIVSPHAGTTRDVIELHLDLDGYPVILLDTAGIREAEDPVEQEGVRRARERAAAADLVLWVTDVAEPVSPPDALGAAVWSLLNKTDLLSGRFADPGSVGVPSFAISARDGLGMDGLLAALRREAGGALEGESVLITRVRHRQALAETSAALARAANEKREDILAEELRLATRSLGRLTGRVDVEDILDVIFRDFCIGK